MREDTYISTGLINFDQGHNKMQVSDRFSWKLVTITLFFGHKIGHILKGQKLDKAEAFSEIFGLRATSCLV